MPAKTNTLSFITYDDTKITLLALYKSVVKSLKWLNRMLDHFFGTIGLTDTLTELALFPGLHVQAKTRLSLHG